MDCINITLESGKLEKDLTLPISLERFDSHTKKSRYRRLLIYHVFPQFIHDKTYDTGSALSLHFVVLGRDSIGISKLPRIKLILLGKISCIKCSLEIPSISLPRTTKWRERAEPVS